MGVYRFRPRVVAFRNDFCLSCASQRRAIQVRTFNVASIHGVPLIPVGFWNRWQCVVCSQSPGYNPRSRRKFAITLALLAAFFAAIFWGLDIEPQQAELWMLIRFISPLAAIGAIIWAIAAERTPSTAERLANVPAATDTACPFCQASLSPGDWRCVNCGVRRR
jgi:hypothetical protein